MTRAPAPQRYGLLRRKPCSRKATGQQTRSIGNRTTGCRVCSKLHFWTTSMGYAVTDMRHCGLLDALRGAVHEVHRCVTAAIPHTLTHGPSYQALNWPTSGGAQ
jgi:hypothetical protein